MANSIAYAQKFLPIIDDIYKAGAVTNILDTQKAAGDFGGVNTVKVLKVSTTGLGDYSRTDGYPKGDVTATWETLTLTEERGKEFSVDRMDDEELRRFNRFSFQMNAEVNMEQYGNILEKRGLDTSVIAQQMLDAEVIASTEPYVPMLTGVLSDSSPIHTVIGSGIVRYVAPYAHRQLLHLCLLKLKQKEK